MKLLVISDTHTDTSFITELNLKYPNMDYYVHCGDSELDDDNSVLAHYLTVRGNNDFAFQNEFLVEFNDFKALIIHGHRQNPYYNLKSLASYAKSKGANLVFFGHIHKPVFKLVDHVYLINPGSTRLPRNTKKGTYCIVDINESVNVVFYDINHDVLVF